MSSIVTKIMSATKKKDVAPDPMSNQETQAVIESIPQEVVTEAQDITENIDAQMPEEYSDFEDDDIMKVMEMWPLGSIREYVLPLAIASTSEQVLDFFFWIIEDRKKVVDSLQF